MKLTEVDNVELHKIFNSHDIAIRKFIKKINSVSDSVFNFPINLECDLEIIQEDYHYGKQ